MLVTRSCILLCTCPCKQLWQYRCDPFGQQVACCSVSCLAVSEPSITPPHANSSQQMEQLTILPATSCVQACCQMYIGVGGDSAASKNSWQYCSSALSSHSPIGKPLFSIASLSKPGIYVDIAHLMHMCRQCAFDAGVTFPLIGSVLLDKQVMLFDWHA